jgi:hypothetical protein
LEEDIWYLASINPRKFQTELEAHLTTGEGYLTSAISRDTWGRAKGALIHNPEVGYTGYLISDSLKTS